MKCFKLIVVLFLIVNVNGFSQSEQVQNEHEEKEGDKLYSNEENDFLQKWFYDNVKEMNLSKKVESEYYRILLNHTSNMERLETNNDKFTNKELKLKLIDIVNEMNIEMKGLLTDNQYKIHVDSFNKILWNVYIRNGWD